MVGMRREAESPSAPTHDMSLSELIHAYQHLAAQAELDKKWMTEVEGAITDHAGWLDYFERGFRKVKPQLSAHRNELMIELDSKLNSFRPMMASPSADGELRAHVKAQDAAMGERLSGVETALREALSGLDQELSTHRTL